MGVLSSLRDRLTTLGKAIRLNQTCLLCGMSSTARICKCCQDDLPRFNLDEWQGNLLHLPWIKASIRSPVFDKLVAIAPYTGVYRGLVTGMKFRRDLAACRALAELFVGQLPCPLTPAPDAILPIPLHPMRLVQRGYNQAVQLALDLGRWHGIPVLSDHVRRIKHTQAQSELDKNSRAANLKGAFALCQPLSGLKHIVVVDDVLTTGATLNAFCRLIRESLPDVFIEVWVMCITHPHR